MRRLPTLTILKALCCTLLLTQVAVFAQEASEAKAGDGLRTPPIIENPEVKVLDTEGAGKLLQVGEHLVCVMEGTHAEMGYQHGRLLSKQIEHIMKEGYQKNALWDRGYTREYVVAQSKRMEKHFPPEYIEELKGLVKGIKAAGIEGLDYDDARLGACTAEILHFDPDAPPGCSNFACWGQWTTDGRLLHGRNLDWDIKSGAQDDAVILVWRPKGGTPFMMVGWAGGIGSVSGMSAKGMTIGEMTLPSPNATFDGLPLLLTMRRVLETTDNLDDAVALIRKGPRTSGWNYIIGDGKVPDGRALEVDAKGCADYKPMDPAENKETLHWSMEDAVRRTNHPVSKGQLLDLAKIYGPQIGITVETWEQLKIVLPMLKSQDTFQRYEWLGNEIQARPKGVDIKEAIQILANGPVYCDVTLHAFVFDPTNQTAYVANAGNNPPTTATDRSFTKIDLKEWFK